MSKRSRMGYENAKNPALGLFLLKFPFPVVITAAFVFLGLLTRLWHPLWMLFLLIPIYYMYACSLRAKTRRGRLAVTPVAPCALLLFLVTGFGLHLWKYAWIVFVLVFLYYWYVIAYVRRG